MNLLSKIYFTVLCLSGLYMVGCTSFQGQYQDPNEVEIIDDRWNETDARKTAAHLVNAMITKPWIIEYTASHNKQRPILVLADVENRTDEHIDVKALTEYITDELLNTGKIRFVNAAARDKINKELDYQHNSGRVDPSKMVAIGKQIGAQFLIMGAISSQLHVQGGIKTVSYQTVLNLTNIETSEMEWSDKYIVKKKFKQSKW